MRTIVDWLRHLLWRAEGSEPPTDGLCVWLAIGDVGLELADGPELLLRAPEASAAVAMLERLARLQTVDEVVVLGADDLPPFDRRRLARAARAQRQHGLWVRLSGL